MILDANCFLSFNISMTFGSANQTSWPTLFCGRDDTALDDVEEYEDEDDEDDID